MMYNNLLLETENNIATVTLNRPDFYNAINDEISYELQDVFKKFKRDDNIRVIILTGAGKAFCSGQDLKAISKSKNRNLADSLHKRYNPIIRAMRTLPKPIICKLNGVAAGAGCSFALACDIIIASEKASLAEVFIKVGLVPDSGSSYFLPRLVGSLKAFELATLGNKVTVEEALKLGMVNRVVPHDELDNAVMELAGHYASAPTKAIGLIKKMLDKSTHSDLDTMLKYEAYCQEIVGNSEDYQEGVQAFNEKRKPEFKGK
jgi:2-(1,2-epoxy-1,2-dihydrophenyl)acetyl-CoA isomerase